jgi:serine/threonine protein kinase
MTQDPDSASDREKRLNDVLAAYLEAVEAGQRPNQQEWLARHPDLAPELTEFFANQERMADLAAPLRAAAPAEGSPDPEAPTLPLGDVAANGPPLGTKVRYFGDYELLEEIARGGMGVVYKARQVSLNRVVALKMILAGQLATEADVKRFKTEAEAAAQLNHPNIVAIHECGQHDGQHYFSMDFVDGHNLAELTAGKPLSAERAARYVKTMAEAVHHAHLRGVLHRDLKPSNVLIDAADQPRITDFGLAKQMEKPFSVTQTGAVLGTPSYMPPEQAGGRRGEVGPPSDVYSLGAILFELLTGRPPFQGDTTMAILVQVLEAEPVSPRKLNPETPADLATICLKCLEKDPSRRYHSARELAEDLGRFLDHEPVLARPASRGRRLWSWARRRPLWMVSGITSFLVLALLALSYWLWTENDFLRWKIDNPDYVRKAGPLTARIRSAQVALMFGMTQLSLLVLLSSRGHKLHLAGLKVPSRVLLAASLGCSLLAVLGLRYVLLLIEALIWEARPWALYFFFGALFVSGVSVGAVHFLAAARGWSTILRGWSGILLQPAEADSRALRELVRQGERAAAIKLYRDRTGAGAEAGVAAIEAIASALRPQSVLLWIFVGLLLMSGVITGRFLQLTHSMFTDFAIEILSGCCLTWASIRLCGKDMTELSTGRKRRKGVRIVLGVLAGLAILACGGIAIVIYRESTPTSWDPKVVDIVKQVGAVYKDAKSIHVDIALETTRESDNKKTEVKTSGTYDIERPNRLALRTKGKGQAGIEYVYDGKQVHVFRRQFNQFVEPEAPASLSDIAQALPTALGYPDTGLLFQNVLTDKPAHAFMEGVNSCSYAGVEKVGGVSAHHMKFNQDAFNWEMWVPTEGKPLVLKYVTTFENGKIVTKEVYSNWKLDEAPAKSVFHFAVPEGARKVKYLWELVPRDS